MVQKNSNDDLVVFEDPDMSPATESEGDAEEDNEGQTESDAAFQCVP